MYPQIKALRDSGMTLRAIAEALNERGVRSQNQRQWHSEAVRLIYETPRGYSLPPAEAYSTPIIGSTPIGDGWD